MSERVIYSAHAARRMFERSIGATDVAALLRAHEVVEAYPTDQPYLSALLVAVVGGRPIHAVVARDSTSNTIVIVTVYIPDPTQWEADHKTRKTP